MDSRPPIVDAMISALETVERQDARSPHTTAYRVLVDYIHELEKRNALLTESEAA